MRYVYSIVRFVPDPARGEYINVGAIVGSDQSSEWQVRQVENPRRAKALDQRGSLGAVWTFLDRVAGAINEHEQAIEQLFAVEPMLSEGWLEHLFTDHRNVVQLSEPAPISADSADEAMASILDLMIVDPERQRRGPTKHTALAALRQAYRDLLKPDTIRERVVARAGRFTTPFDFAIANGHLVQLSHAWSFRSVTPEDVSQQVKAWGWTVGEMKQSGGVVESRAPAGVTFEYSDAVDIEVVVIPPGTGEQFSPYREALDVFDRLDVPVRALEQTTDVVRVAQELLQHREAGRTTPLS